MSDFLFDGNAKSRRQISLGGTSAQRGKKDDFMENARREREKRHRAKVEDRSSRLIQETWRLCRKLEVAKNTMRSQWDTLFVLAAKKETRTEADIASLIKPLLSFFKSSVDMNRFVGLGKLWIPLALSNAQVNYYNTPQDTEYRQQLWGLRHSRMLGICLRGMAKNVPADIASVAVILYANLTKMTNPEIESRHSIEQQQKTIAMIHPKDYEAATSLWFREDLKQILRQTDTQWKDTVIGFAIIPLKARGSVGLVANDGIFESFAKTFLAVPSIWSQISERVMREITSGPIWEGCLDACLSPGMSSILNDRTTGQRLLGNLAEVCKITFKANNATSLLCKYITVVSTLLKTVRLSSGSVSRDGNDSGSDMSDGESGQQWISTNIRNQLHTLFYPSLIAPLLKVMSAYSLSEGSLSSFCCVCSLYSNAILTLPAMKVEILNSLAFSTDCVRKLWDWMVGSQYLDKLATTGITDETAEMAAPICLFSLAYSHLLMILDREEFFEKKHPFSFEELARLVATFKKIAVKAAKLDPTARKAMCSGVKFEIDAIVKVLHNLYERQCRQQFVDPSVWLELGMTADIILKEVNMERTNSILEEIPFVIPFEERVSIFRKYIRSEGEGVRGTFFGGHRIKVRRDFIIEDSLEQLNHLGSDLKKRIQVMFVNELGVEEAGIDGGGLFKEYATHFMRAAFGPSYGLFKSTADECIYPNPGSELVASDHLEQFAFLGRMLGKMVFEEILVDVPFARFFLSKLLGRYNYVDELPSLDPELSKQLNFLKHYEGDFEDLCLSFSIMSDEYGEAKTIDLLPNGSNIPVTRENSVRYIHLVANFHLNTNIRRQCNAFMHGFQDLIPKEYLQMFSPDELHIVICGSKQGINIQDWQANTIFNGVLNSSFVDYFWEIVKEMTDEERGKLLRFTTSCARAPILGFKCLDPLFSVQCVTDDSRLPTASTCVNLLKLPNYKSKEIMKEKLLYAISSGAGFDLS